LTVVIHGSNPAPIPGIPIRPVRAFNASGRVWGRGSHPYHLAGMAYTSNRAIRFDRTIHRTSSMDTARIPGIIDPRSPGSTSMVSRSSVAPKSASTSASGRSGLRPNAAAQRLPPGGVDAMLAAWANVTRPHPTCSRQRPLARPHRHLRFHGGFTLRLIDEDAARILCCSFRQEHLTPDGARGGPTTRAP
jgi:hypothetical protein